MILGLDPRVVHERPGVGDEAAHRRTDVNVDLRDLLDAPRLEEGRRQALLDREDRALLRLQADGRRAELYRLDGVLHLEEPSLGGEGVHAPVVFGAGQVHCDII